MRARAAIALSLLCVGTACRSTAIDPFVGARWQACVSSSDASLRGLCALDASVAWASGSKGTVLRTLDGGATFAAVGPADGAALDFRSLHAFDRDRALIASAGTPARVYATDDGGAHWRIVHEDARKEAFFDALAFADAQHGLLFGDPIDGQLQLFATDDGGAHWRQLPPAELPKPQTGEAAFAASGRCLIARAPATFAIVTGGTVARFLRSDDGGAHWRTTPLPLAQGRAAAGAFAVASDDGEHWCAVGGDYERQNDVAGTACWSDDGGRSWTMGRPPADGYRCGLAWLRGGAWRANGGGWLAVGDRGASVSTDGGRSWCAFGSDGFHTVACAPDGSVWAAGSRGRIARLRAQD